MKNQLLLTALMVCLIGPSFGQSNFLNQDTRLRKTYLDNKRVLDKTYQYELLKSPTWQNFVQEHGNWYVWFNEENAKPHRAYGEPIRTVGATPEDKAMNFITNELGDFNIPIGDLQLTNSNKNKKMFFINYHQLYNGLKVQNSNLTVRLNSDGDVILWGADVYNDIDIDVTPSLSEAQAGSSAAADITTPIESTVVKPELVVLPIPDRDHPKQNKYKLVYEVNVHTTEINGIPANWYTLVDANNGEVYYRHNEVYTCGIEHDHSKACKPENKLDAKNKIANAKMEAANIEVTVQGTVYPSDPSNPTAVLNLANIDLTVGGTGYTLDGNGYVMTSETGTATANIPLQGTWCRIVNDGTSSTPSISVSVNDAAPNTVSVDGGANIIERSAYNNVNVIHDYMKTVLPSFTGMDWQLPTNVEITPHECNAFYNGSSINFYTDNTDCYSLAQVNDVVFHEYGHGINYEFYSDNGMFFQNGAMGEGYADVWAYAEFEDPLLGDGHNPGDFSQVIRRYDIDPKVYPNDLVGQVHADGEIIAGAWWDLYLNLGNDMPAMMDLFAVAYLGGQAQNADGNEGQAYTEVLLDCLLADDTDGDISNGTPNDAAIVEAFRAHGITLISNAVLTHTPVEAAAGATGIEITANLSLGLPWSDYLSDVQCVYQVNDNGNWDTIPLANTSGSTWNGQIPAQPNGSIVAYYIGAEDVNGVLSAVEPVMANNDDANLPYYVLVGYGLELQEDGYDFVSSFGNWTAILPDDNATTGTWENVIPVGSWGTPGDNSTMVAPDHQHTPGGQYCWVTGRSASTTDGLGVNDVDAGKTTIQLDPIDLSMYTNPAISYWRWYTNNPPSGANPNADWWQVYISNDGGSSWTFVEETKTSDRSWRRNAFRIQDYTTVTNNMMLRFVASDSTRPGQYLNGGSLVEAALDDIRLWEEIPASVDDIEGVSNFRVYPNPASTMANLSFVAQVELEDVDVEIVNHMGQVVFTHQVARVEDQFRLQIDVSGLAAGIYHVTIRSGGHFNNKKLSIQK